MVRSSSKRSSAPGQLTRSTRFHKPTRQSLVLLLCSGICIQSACAHISDPNFVAAASLNITVDRHLFLSATYLANEGEHTEQNTSLVLHQDGKAATRALHEAAETAVQVQRRTLSSLPAAGRATGRAPPRARPAAASELRGPREPLDGALRGRGQLRARVHAKYARERQAKATTGAGGAAKGGTGGAAKGGTGGVAKGGTRAGPKARAAPRHRAPQAGSAAGPRRGAGAAGGKRSSRASAKALPPSNKGAPHSFLLSNNRHYTFGKFPWPPVDTYAATDPSAWSDLGELTEEQMCSDAADHRRYEWVAPAACERGAAGRTVPCLAGDTGQVRGADPAARGGQWKAVYTGRDCAFQLHDQASVAAKCAPVAATKRGKVSVVNLGASVARSTFKDLCGRVGAPISIPDSEKHAAFACSSALLDVHSLFMHGFYDAPYQTQAEYTQLKAELQDRSGKYKIPQIWKQKVPEEERFLPQLARMVEGAGSPWGDGFAIQDADLVFFAPGVWDVAYSRNVDQYRRGLRTSLDLLGQLNVDVIVRTIPAFFRRRVPPGMRWDYFYQFHEAVTLVPIYNQVLKEVVAEFVRKGARLSVLDVENVPRDDETYDGIHFSRVELMDEVGYNGRRLTGECSAVITNWYLTMIVRQCDKIKKNKKIKRSQRSF